jgi:hypothetical protein
MSHPVERGSGGEVSPTRLPELGGQPCPTSRISEKPTLERDEGKGLPPERVRGSASLNVQRWVSGTKPGLRLQQLGQAAMEGVHDFAVELQPSAFFDDG